MIRPTYLQLTDNSISLTLNNIYLRYWEPPHKSCPGASTCLNPALVRTVQYGKTKTTVLYSKHNSLNIPDLLKLSVAKFMYSFNNGELPNHFDNNFSEIASVHKYQIRLTSWRKYNLPRIKASMGQLSLKYIDPKIWSDIPEDLKSLTPYTFGKQ